MGDNKGGRRRSGKVDRLPSKRKDVVDQMLLEGITYREIVEYLRNHDHVMSQMAISTYARKFLADVKMLNIAQENFAMMMEEINKYPNLDTTEAITRVLSSYVFEAITSKEKEDWENIDAEKLLRESTALIRAASYKKRIDVQNQTNFDAGIESARTLVFETMAKERPELYKEFNSYLSEKKRQREGVEENE